MITMFLANLIPFIVYLAFTLYALSHLRDRTMDDMAKFLWTALIVFAPIVGALAFFIIKPGRPSP